MRLAPGKNIGHFEILGQLGGGGMGEVYLALDKQLNRKVALKLLDLPRSENLPLSETRIRWTPDGRAIAYILTENEVSNIWAQPIDGGPAKQLTDFKSEHIFNFAWSRDGQKIALSRGVVNRDVVLITGFK